MSVLHLFKSYLSTEHGFESRAYKVISFLVLALWLSIVVITSVHHEVWRDETRALWKAVEPKSILALPEVIKNDGHPILWFLILRIGFLVTHTPVVLKILSVSIGFCAVFIFYRHAPFPIFQRLLFIFGALPLYEYSVYARNYGISMLLFFLFSLFYPFRKKHPLVLAVILVLLANTNIHSTIFTGLLALFWFFDLLKKPKAVVADNYFFKVGVSYIIITLGILFVFYTVLPGRDSMGANVSSFDVATIFKAFVQNILHPGMNYNRIFCWGLPQLKDLAVWLLMAGLLIRMDAALVFFTGVVVCGTLFSAIYPGFLRHQGIFMCFFMSLYWIIRQQKTGSGFYSPKVSAALQTFHDLTVKYVLTALLISQVAYAGYLVNRDLQGEISSNRSFAKFLKANSEYSNAILVGESVSSVASLTYYTDHPIYSPRDGRYGKSMSLDRSSKKHLSLGDVLRIAEEIKAKKNRPVLIVLSEDVFSKDLPFEKRYFYGQTFTCTQNEVDTFSNKTVKIGEFRKALKNKNENYTVFNLKQ